MATGNSQLDNFEFPRSHFSLNPRHINRGVSCDFRTICVTTYTHERYVFLTFVVIESQAREKNECQFGRIQHYNQEAVYGLSDTDQELEDVWGKRAAV